MKKTSVIRKEHFNSAHRLHNPNWSDTEQGANSFMKMIEQIMGSKNKVGNAYETIKKDLGNNLDIRTLIENDNDNN